MGLDQLDLVAEEVGLESSSEGENTDQESEHAPLVDEPVSAAIPGGPSVAQISLALIAIQRRFKVSTAAMDSFAELLKVATGEGSRSPSFFSARSMEEKSDIDYRVVDVCPNDCCVFENAPKHCDPRGMRHHGGLQKCPECHESRNVLVGPDKGTPRKQIIVFSLKDTIKMLFAQPGFSQKLNTQFGQPHPLTKNEDCEMQVPRCTLIVNLAVCRTFGTRGVGNNKCMSVPK